MTESPSTEQFDVVVIGAGPAGLSAALNLVRARRRVLVLDSNRPRNAATFASHGFVTRDGISPLELRRLGREELEGYEGATFAKAMVTAIEPGFVVTAGAAYEAKAVVIATGLTERFPALPSLRAFYGTSIHSCVECDAYEYADAPIALIGETDDLAERALLLSQWSRDLIVFTNAVGSLTDAEQARLSSLGVTVDRRPIADVTGDRDGLRGITMADGDVIPRSGAFVRPIYQANLGYAASLGLSVTDEGWITIDDSGRTSVAGVYAAGDSAAPGPQQLIVAAGAGARVAAAVNRDLLA